MTFSLIGPSSPLLRMYAKACLPGTRLYSLDNYESLPKDVPVVFICADTQRTINFFKRVTPKKIFSGKRSIAVFADASKPIWKAFGKALLPHIDAYVTADCADNPFDSDKWIPDVYLPIAEIEWAKESQDKPIDLGFYGSVQLYKERLETLKYLRESGLNPSIGGGIDGGYSLNFMGALRHTKVTINFSNCNVIGQNPIHHIKGRVWEAAMARTAIIETRNDITPKLFTDEEITWFDRKEELPGLIRDLLSDDKRRNSMTARLFDKAKNYTDIESFWGRLQ